MSVSLRLTIEHLHEFGQECLECLFANRLARPFEEKGL